MAAQISRGPIVSINVTPFVDVVLVLLVIFMATSSYIVNPAIELDLPEAASGDDVVATTLSISLTGSGELYLDGERTNLSQLAARCRGVSEEDDQAQVVIAADGTATHRQVIQLIDLVKHNGIESFALSVESTAVEE